MFSPYNKEKKIVYIVDTCSRPRGLTTLFDLAPLKFASQVYRALSLGIAWQSGLVPIKVMGSREAVCLKSVAGV